MNIIYDKLDKCVKPSVFSIFVRYIISLTKAYGLPQNSKHTTWTRVRGRARVSNSTDLLGIRHDAKYQLESKMGVGV